MLTLCLWQKAKTNMKHLKSFLKPLNRRGIAHFMAPLLIIVLIAIGGTAAMVASHADSTSGSLMVLFSSGGTYDKAKISLQGNPQIKHKCGTSFNKDGSGKSLISIPAPSHSKAGIKPLACTPTGTGVIYAVTFGKAGSDGTVAWQPSAVMVDIDTSMCTFVHADGNANKVSNASGKCNDTAKTDPTDAPKPKPPKPAKLKIVKDKAKAKAATAPLTLNIATYNVLGASHTDAGGDTPGRAAYGDRIVRAVNVMKTNKFDVVGLQELESKQRSTLLQSAGNTYDIYPTSDISANRQSENSIIWDESKFSLLAGGSNTIAYDAHNNRDLPWVKLQAKANGHVFYVFNTHDPLNNDNPQYREQAAREHLSDLRSKATGDTPAFLTGDFNSSFDPRTGKDFADRSRLSYCILTAGGDIFNTYDLFHKKTGACPTTGTSAIDHIYVSNGVTVKKWKHLRNSDTNYASDHDPVFVNVSF